MPPRARMVPMLVGMPSMMNFDIQEFGLMSMLVIPMVKSALMISYRYWIALSASEENGVWRTIVCLPVTSANINLNSMFNLLLILSRIVSLMSLGGSGSATGITISLGILHVTGLKS